MTEELDRAVAAYVDIRDRLDAERKKFKDIEKHYKEKLQEIADYLAKHMGEDVEATRTKHGTAFWAVKDFVSVQDAEAFFGFVVETDNTQMLNKSANKTAVKEYMAEHDDIPPPGLEYGTSREIQVRRPTK